MLLNLVSNTNITKLSEDINDSSLHKTSTWKDL